jgi:Domain of unknown function (DUF4304)
VPSSSKIDAQQFKKLFSEVAVARDFVWDHGGWFRESPECVIVLDLQKSDFGNYFELNIKIFVQGLFNDHYSRSKEMVKRLTGDVFLRPPSRFRPVLDLDEPMTRDERARAIEALFNEFVTPISADALTRAGLITLAARELVHLLPAVRKQLIGDLP